MSKKENTSPADEAEVLEETEGKTEPSEAAEEKAPETPEAADNAVAAQLADAKDQLLRLAAEYDNFRRRTQKEKEAIYDNAKADTVKALLPVYDNLERAMNQETTDEAYKKGVEMTMAGLKKAMEDLGVHEIPALGQPFDPAFHNAVMHIDDESFGENTIAEVFQTGFTLGDKVIRFSMVKVAN